ncbi:LysM peptidoglycan-binding domain-containing protein [Lysinibacillus sp. OL1_EC]|uniref:C40 family peptidase n=1 Tax=unclassified Lysinibacillus TaxID=2636778 RepID=UPI00103D5C05|nr:MULTISPECIES: C40 family peptidase [unclassified Lysinibacillus]MCM0626349.1 LysM peptidoglycan-binding domain-containing protein [Lysinibacillus sp. OL1_EC]MCS5503230.1 LysM peptidoglycan-binding domain-containing protein [Lysinibacillus sp. A4]TBV88120.1 peptidoglycan endopeptidase [Lysinibacillus sp. OL1]UKJ46016.1 LysM peptidoglycan-binding domain-containing protein [Lysinibacillus sp. ACHW1.5]
MQKTKKWRILVLSTLATSFLALQTAEAATYTVQKGDTLTKIAQNHQVTIGDIMKWNNLSKDTIYVAQKLEIPKQSSNEEVKPSTPSTSGKPAASSHTVAKGDTLSKIAKLYNVTIKEIMDWNKLEKDTIFVGQVLKLSPGAVIPDGGTIHNNVTSGTGTPSKVTAKDPTANGQAIYNKTVEVANTLVGTPYLYGGNTPVGLDCSGFIFYAFNQGGLKIGRASSEGYFYGNTTHVENPVPGDLVFFENTYKEGISHMGIYLGDNKFIHAGTDGVEVSDVTYSYWSSKLVAYKRFDSVK